jgi:hypothetical protein
MSVMPGFGDLKPRDILMFNQNGTLLVDMGGSAEVFQMQISPTGFLTARAVEKQEPDQVQSRRTLSREQRLAMTDQGQALLERG